MDEFVVARNPDSASALPFLLYLPIDGGLWLRAKDSWPRTTRVFCQLTEPPRTAQLDVLERIGVASCVRRGPAIDLILARAHNKRSQFVFTTSRGRQMILWQTPKAAVSARPGVRIPAGRSATVDTIYVDTRERYPYKFESRGVTIKRRALPAGDYAVELSGGGVAAVERKTLEGFATSLSDATLSYAMAELASLPAAAVVVEGTYSALLRHEFTPAGYNADLVARLHVRYPTVQIVFAESRKLAEEWTFRFLKAALSHHARPELEFGAPVLEPPAPAKKAKRASRDRRSLSG